jgi:hypothetical protein
VITYVALAVCMLSIGVCAVSLFQLREGWKLVREREDLADAYEKVLGRRETELRRREKAVWWAEKTQERIPERIPERSPRWVR